MRRIALLILISAWLAAPGSAAADPLPCSEDELLQTSDYAIEGYAVRVECGEPYDSGDCTDEPPADPAFRPELVSDCWAAVKVTRSLKGDYVPGDEVEIPFLKVVEACQNGTPKVPGKPKKIVRLHSKVRYFNSETCAYSNFAELEAPFLRGDASADQEIDLADPVRILLHLFVDSGGLPPSPAMDADGDGSFTVTDAIFALRYLFSGGPPPPDPFFRPSRPLRITVVYDNYLLEPGLETDWGFSCVLETEDRTVLVDTGNKGKSAMFFGNLASLGFAPRRMNLLVLSHEHPDHVGGLSAFLSEASFLPVYLPASFPASIRNEVRAFGMPVIDVSGPVEISKGLVSSGELAGSPIEHVFFLRAKPGLIVITTCAHPGIVKVAEEARRQMGVEEIHLLLGGYHLFQKGDSEVREVIRTLRGLGVKKVGPCHCSGDRARELFKEEYGADYVEVGVGARIVEEQP